MVSLWEFTLVDAILVDLDLASKQLGISKDLQTILAAGLSWGQYTKWTATVKKGQREEAS